MDECPLCGCKVDESDKNFKPCPCNYQVCSFCFNKLVNDKDIDPLCPACRQPYNLKKIKFIAPVNPTPTKNVNKTIKKKKKKEKESAKKKEEILIKNRKELENVRVLQRNLVYITNIPLSLAKEEILKKHEYFGQYGNITKIVVNKGKYFNTTAPGGPSVSAYVTFDKKRLEDTYLCIMAVDGCWLENRTLRASYGTTKYCSYFLKNITCTNSNCMYLHSLGRKEDSFTKEEMSQGKHLIDTTMNLDLNQIPKPNKPSVLPPPGVIAKDLPKEKRKKGYFDPSETEKKEISIKLPQQKQESTNPSDNKSSTEEVTEKMEFVKLTEEKDAESSTGEEEESDQDDSEHFQHSSEDVPILNNRGDELSFSEKVKAKNSKKIHYSDISTRYKKSNQLPRRKPSGEVEEVQIPPNLLSKPIRKHSEHNYEPVDFPRQDNSFFRRHSENGHEKGKTKNKFENNVMNRNKYPPPHPSNMYRSRGSDGSIFGNLPSINEENEFLPFSSNIWSNEDNGHPRSKHNDEYILPKRVVPPPTFQEVEGDMRIPPYMMNPNFHYGYPLVNPQYGSHYLNEGKTEDRGSFSQKLPNYAPNYGPNFQNPFYKQKGPSELYWGGYPPPNGYMYPTGYPPNMGYPGGYPNYPNYPNYPPYHPNMYPQQEHPHLPQNHPQQENVKENGGETSPIPNTKKGSGPIPTSTPVEPTRLPSSSTPSIFPSHYTQPPSTQKHPNSTNVPNGNTNPQQQLPLFYTQRSSQDSFSEHPSHQPRNYPMFQNMYQPNPNLPPHHLQHGYPLFPPNHNPNYFSGSFLTSNFLPPNHPNSSSHPQHTSSLPHLLSHQDDDSHLTESILPPSYVPPSHGDDSDKSSEDGSNNNNSTTTTNKDETPKPSEEQPTNTSHKNTNK